MGVILQAAYRRRTPKGAFSVPSPHDGKANTPWWYDHLVAQAHDFAAAGFTAVLLPPVLKTSAGAFPGADGYGAYDDYDIGGKDQFFSVPTRFGTREQLQRLCAILHANGLDPYLDTVMHQRIGGRAGVYRYRGADGKTMNGRFPKDPGCFFGTAKGWRPRDPVYVPEDDFGFGDELCPINALPKGYVRDGLIAASNWLTRALDARGYRIDDTKGLAPQFVADYLRSGAMADTFAGGELYDGNLGRLDFWGSRLLNGRCATYDFPLYFIIRDMCNNAAQFDMRRLARAGYIAMQPLHAVTFVENHDTDVSGNPVIWNKIMGYAVIMTMEGYPQVYYKDYSTDPGCYGLKPLIDNLIWIHEHLANGTTAWRFADDKALIYERQGPPGLLVGLNSNSHTCGG